MNKFIAAALISTCLALNTAAQTNSESVPGALPGNFKTDGCTLFPDGDYKNCCVSHDLAYFNGGTLRERLRADNVLFKCVANKKGWWHKIVAPVMWTGVRIGGVSFLPTPFRWGFGKNTKPAVAGKRAATENKLQPEQKLF
jgi:hypothetical protein